MKDLLLPVAVAVAFAFLIQSKARWQSRTRSQLHPWNPRSSAATASSQTGSSGLPGDHLFVEADKREVTINGTPFDVAAAGRNPRQGPGADLRSRSFDVPEDHIFVLGDNRDNSCDSHQWSNPFVPIDAVTGQVEAIYWPPRHIAFLK